MSGSVNKVILVGRLGKDPEAKFIPSGKKVVRFSLATDENWKNAAGEKQSRTEWHNIVVWDKLADICEQYLVKGRMVYLEGTIQSREYESNGQKRLAYEIKANQMQMLGSKEDAPAGATPAPATHGKTADPVAPEVSDEDIPF